MNNYEYFGQAHLSIFNGKKATFNDWQRHCQDVRKSFIKDRTARQVEIDGMSDTWAQRVIDERKAQYAKLNAKEAAQEKSELLNDLETVIGEKQKKIAAAMKSPGSDAVEALQLLSMRNSLTPGDIVAVLPQFENSLLALQALRDLAISRGINFPVLPSIEKLNDSIEKIREFAADMIDSLDSEKLSFLQTLFWTTDFPGMIQESFDALDTPSFLTVDAKSITAKLSNDEAKPATSKDQSNQIVATKVTLNGSEYLDTIARQFGTTKDAIKKLNNDLSETDLQHGKVITVPGTLKYDETATGHISTKTHTLEPVYSD